MGTTTQGVLEVLISLKNDTLLKAEYRDGMYDLEEELGRKKWNLTGISGRDKAKKKHFPSRSYGSVRNDDPGKAGWIINKKAMDPARPGST